MAIIGFIIMLLIALWFLFGALVSIYATSVFGGKVEWLGTILYGTISAIFLWFALNNIPFKVVLQ